MFAEIEASGRDFARSITADIGSAIQDLNRQLAEFTVTGKLSLKSIGQSLQANIFGSILRKAESGLFSSLGNLFGLGNSNKPDGSSQGAALWVQMSNPIGAAAGIGTLPLGNLNGVASLLGGITGGGGNSGLLKGLGSIGKGIGGIFGGIFGSLFGGFRDSGGDTQPGRAYIVGEKRPELFIPRSAGTVIPSVSGSGENKTTVMHNHLHISGVSDADSFRKSQTQIFNGMSRVQQRLMSRA
jgi:hypothetical protein